MHTTVEEGFAQFKGGVHVATIVISGLTAIQLDLCAFELVIQNDVQYAGNRVGAVCRRCATGHHVNPFDHDGRYDVEID